MNTQANTSISVGLLSAPIKLFNATSKLDEVSFGFCTSDGETVERVYRGEESGEVIEYESLVKMYEGKIIDPTELARVEAACVVDKDDNNLKHIRIDHFMPLKDVPMHRAENLYYIGPNVKAGTPDSFNALVAGMKRKKVAAVAKVVIRSRQKLFVLFVENGILHAASLYFAANIVQPLTFDLIRKDTVKKPVLDLMMRLIDSSMGDNLDDMEDTFVARKRELVEKAVEGKPVVILDKTAEQDDLLIALEESMKQVEKRRQKKRAKA